MQVCVWLQKPCSLTISASHTLQLAHHPWRWHFKCFLFEKTSQWGLIGGLFFYLKQSKCHSNQINARPTISDVALMNVLYEFLPLMKQSPEAKGKPRSSLHWHCQEALSHPESTPAYFSSIDKHLWEKGWTLMARILCLLSHRNSRWFSAILGLCQNLKLRDKRLARNHKYKVLNPRSSYY